jgi:hypothetical protein
MGDFRPLHVSAFGRLPGYHAAAATSQLSFRLNGRMEAADQVSAQELLGM